MDVLQAIQDWARDFFGLHDALAIIRSGDYSQLRTVKGLMAFVGPLFPIFVVLEFFLACLYKRFQVMEYKIPFFSYLLNLAIGQFVSITAVGFVIGWLEPLASLQVPMKWHWFLYGYIVWELGHFFYHYTTHKVRLLWCLHSTHHAPESMNLSISFAHFFLEFPYAGVVRTATCMLLGVPPPMLFIIMFVDGVYGGFVHIGETLGRRAKLRFLYKWILTPSHHRVHHGKNPLYLDTNFCNLLNIWDRVFRTYQPEEDAVPVDYGITRPMKKNSFLDAYFGEIYLLGHAVWHAPGVKNKLLYLMMQPGWSHTGEHKTSAKVKRELRKRGEVYPPQAMHAETPLTEPLPSLPPASSAASAPVQNRAL